MFMHTAFKEVILVGESVEFASKDPRVSAPGTALAEHNITQSMSRKGNCMDNGIMENFFGRLKVEMYYGEKFESPMGFIEKLEEYIHYYNNDRISLKLNGMSPVQYRTHSQAS